MNVEIKPGIYVASGGDSCYWERVSGFSGTLDDILANDFGNARPVVEILSTDAGFESSNCVRWTAIEDAISPQTTIPDGTWLVGEEVSPGTYAAPGGESCYWERLSGFSGDFDDIIANGLSESRSIVEIASSDVGFSTNGCGEWTPIS